MGTTPHRARLRLALAVSLATFAQSAPARAGDAPTSVIVIDGSASMWGRLAPDNRPKIDVAREALSTAIGSAPQTRIGVVSFGQRRADCSDAEVINAPGLQHDAALQTLAKLNPRGRGPTAFAIRAAATAIGSSRPSRVLVVSDGADNCAQDACTAAAEFAKSAPDVPIDVVGISIPENEKAHVACIAKETGGRYFAAQTAPELAAAIDESSKLALFATVHTSASDPPGSAAKPALPPPPAGAALRVAATLAEKTPPIDADIEWRVFKDGEQKAAAESKGRAIALKLPPGDYEIEAQLGDLKGRKKVSIAAGSSESIAIPLDGAHLAVHAGTAKEGAPLPTAALSISSPGKMPTIVRGSSADLYLPPGSYTVGVSDGTARQSREIALAAGDDEKLDLALRAGTIELSTTTDVSGRPPGDILYIVAEDDPYSPSGRREVARSMAPNPSFVLPAGTYYVSAQSGYAAAVDRVALGVGDSVKQALKLDAATLKVAASIGGAPPNPGQSVVLKIERLDGDKSEVTRRAGVTARFTLSPGRYRVTATVPRSHLSAVQEVALSTGQVADANINIPGGTVTFAPPATNLDIYWEVTDAQGVAVWRATGNTATAVLAPGAYTVHLDARGKRKSAKFDVRDGETRTMEIGPG